MSCRSLSKAGVETMFEPVAPVGEIPALPDSASGGELFPHLHGGIPTTPGAVLAETAVVRNADGTFASIDGVTDGTAPPRFSPAATVAAAAALAGALLLLARRR